ncbi:MAG: lysophospholipid acyltransferase family protein [Candidatus Wallbacteria bacterium]|nr:lysophospholipid acyltransferase family protein [Candidatus Wallbacteria bacterium]
MDIGVKICKFWLDILLFAFMVSVIPSFKEKKIPANGLLLASNHFSNLDPPLIFYTYPEMVSIVSKKEILDLPFIGWLFRDLGTIRINRQAFGQSTLKAITERLAERNVLLFPEGTRSLDGEIKNGKPGFGYLVQKLRIPVMPLYIDSFSILPKKHFLPAPGTVKINFGKILTFEEISAKIGCRDEKESYQEITHLIMEEIRNLRDESKSNSDGGGKLN